MAKKINKPGLPSVIDLISGIFPTSQLEKAFPEPQQVSTKLISESERDKLIERTVLARGNDNTNRAVSFVDYIRRTAMMSAQNRVENAQILQLAPEIQQAIAIIWSAIMAPNDLKASKVEVFTKCKRISADQDAKIRRKLTDFFDGHLNLSTAIPEWGAEAMHKSGAKPFLLLPVNTLQKKFQEDVNPLNGSTESYRGEFERLSKLSIFGFGDDDLDKSYDTIVAATESYSAASLNPVAENLKLTKNNSLRGAVATAKYKDFVKSVISTESLSMVDNPDATALSIAKTRVTRKSMTKKMAAYYSEKPTDSIVVNANDSVIDHPILLELTKEAVIPIFAPGNPNDPIGYIVILDDYGHPTNVTEFADKGLNTRFSAGNNTNNFNQLFQAFGYGNNPNLQNGNGMTVRDHDVMADIYKNIVEAHIKDRLANGGLANVDIGTNETVFRFLFSRYLQKRRTKMLFVPNELLTYFTFKRDANGIGVSKLEEIKHILSLRTTLLTCRLLTAVDASIARKNIAINIPPEFEGDILEHIYNVLNATIQKETFQFGYDPDAIAAQVAEKKFSVSITGVPEFDYSINSQVVEKAKAEIDEQLFDSLTKLFILGLDIPPSAINALSEDEYSRSVATMNLFFSRKVVAWQQVVCECIGKLVRDFVTFSGPLRQDLRDILKTGADDGKTVDKIKVNDGTTTSSRTDITVVDDDDLIREVIEGLTISLPSPNVAPDNAHLDTVEKMLDNIDKLVSMGLPDEFAGDNQDVGRVLTMSRAATKVSIAQSLFKTLGFGDMHIPTPDEIDLNALLGFKTTLTNAAAALNQADKLLVSAMGKDTLGGDDTQVAPDDDGMGGDDTSGNGDDFLGQTGGDPGLDAQTGGDAGGDPEGSGEPPAGQAEPPAGEDVPDPNGQSLV